MRSTNAPMILRGFPYDMADPHDTSQNVMNTLWYDTKSRKNTDRWSLYKTESEGADTCGMRSSALGPSSSCSLVASSSTILSSSGGNERGANRSVHRVSGIERISACSSDSARTSLSPAICGHSRRHRLLCEERARWQGARKACLSVSPVTPAPAQHVFPQDSQLPHQSFMHRNSPLTGRQQRTPLLAKRSRARVAAATSLRPAVV
jgi:hypothetical protein